MEETSDDNLYAFFSLFSNELWTFALFKLARVDVGNESKKGKNMEGIIT